MNVPTPPSPTPPQTDPQQQADPHAEPLTRSLSADALRVALSDTRVATALHLALRDVQLRGRFDALREEGLTVAGAIEHLRGPHHDASGRPYYLSDERVRSIVYRKDQSR